MNRAEASLRGLGERVIVSDFAGAEFASVIAKRVRMRDLSLNEGKQALAAVTAAFQAQDRDAARMAVLRLKYLTKMGDEIRAHRAALRAAP